MAFRSRHFRDVSDRSAGMSWRLRTHSFSHIITSAKRSQLVGPFVDLNFIPINPVHFSRQT
jgi:hypothetical protein